MKKRLYSLLRRLKRAAVFCVLFVVDRRRAMRYARHDEED